MASEVKTSPEGPSGQLNKDRSFLKSVKMELRLCCSEPSIYHDENIET